MDGFEIQSYNDWLIMFVRKCIKCKNDVFVENSKITLIYCEDCKKERKLFKIEQSKTKYVICSKCNKPKRLKKTVVIEDKHVCKSCIKFENGIIRNCRICEAPVQVYNRKCTIVTCDNCKSKDTSLDTVKRICVKCKNEFMCSTKSRSFKCENCRNIYSKKQKHELKFAKKTHFGYYGVASDGHQWWSLNEQDFEEWLIDKNIKHEPHKRIGDSLKRSDQYLPDFDLYVEIDGLSRENDAEWNGKLSLYKKCNLNVKIVKTFQNHYIDNRYLCFMELDKVFEFLIEQPQLVEI